MPVPRLCECGECKRCRHRVYMQDWTLRNREHVREWRRGRYANDETRQEAAKKRAREWYEANRERAKRRARERYHTTKVLKGRPTGIEHVNWKGDAVGYGALHRWLERYRGKPSECEHCGVKTAKRFEWANVDHKYRRELNDWLRLCTSCHRRYDYKHGLAAKGGRRPKATR